MAWFVAQEKGYFKKHEVEAKLIMTNSIDESFALFDAGKLDANSQPWADTLVRAAQKVPAKTFLVVDHSVGADALMVGESIKRLSDLRGAKIALEEIAITQFLLDTALAKGGLTTKDVQLSFMPTGDAAKALIAGKIQAAVVWNPFVNEIQSKRKGRPLFSTRDFPGVISDVIVANEQSLKDKRKEFLGLIRAWYDVERFLQSNREEAIAIMAKAVKQKPSEYRYFLNGVRLLDQPANLQAFGGRQVRVH